MLVSIMKQEKEACGSQSVSDEGQGTQLGIPSTRFSSILLLLLILRRLAGRDESPLPAFQWQLWVEIFWDKFEATRVESGALYSERLGQRLPCVHLDPKILKKKKAWRPHSMLYSNLLLLHGYLILKWIKTKFLSYTFIQPFHPLLRFPYSAACLSPGYKNLQDNIFLTFWNTFFYAHVWVNIVLITS